MLGLELDDRVERRARRLAPDLLPQFRPDLLERQRQHEHLGDRLDRELLVAIPGAPDAPVLVREGDAELGGIGPRQRWNIGRDLAGRAMRRGRGEHLGEHVVHGRIGPAPAGPVKLFHGGNGCPARIRTSIDGVRVRSLTVRRRGNREGGEIGRRARPVNAASPRPCRSPPPDVQRLQVRRRLRPPETKK